MTCTACRCEFCFVCGQLWRDPDHGTNYFGCNFQGPRTATLMQTQRFTAEERRIAEGAGEREGISAAAAALSASEQTCKRVAEALVRMRNQVRAEPPHLDFPARVTELAPGLAIPPVRFMTSAKKHASLTPSMDVVIEPGEGAPVEHVAVVARTPPRSSRRSRQDAPIFFTAAERRAMEGRLHGDDGDTGTAAAAAGAAGQPGAAAAGSVEGVTAEPRDQVADAKAKAEAVALSRLAVWRKEGVVLRFTGSWHRQYREAHRAVGVASLTPGFECIRISLEGLSPAARDEMEIGFVANPIATASGEGSLSALPTGGCFVLGSHKFMPTSRSTHRVAYFRNPRKCNTATLGIVFNSRSLPSACFLAMDERVVSAQAISGNADAQFPVLASRYECVMRVWSHFRCPESMLEQAQAILSPSRTSDLVTDLPAKEMIASADDWAVLQERLRGLRDQIEAACAQARAERISLMRVKNRGDSLTALNELDLTISQLAPSTPSNVMGLAMDMRQVLATFCRRQGLEVGAFVGRVGSHFRASGPTLQLAREVSSAGQVIATQLEAHLRRLVAQHPKRNVATILNAPASVVRWGGTTLATVAAGSTGATVSKTAQAEAEKSRTENLDPTRLDRATAQSNLEAVTQTVRVVLDASPKLAWAKVQAVYCDPRVKAFVLHRASHGIAEVEALAGVVCGLQSLAEVDVFQLRRRTSAFQRLFAGLHAACEADAASMGMGTILAEISRQSRGQAALPAAAAAATA